MVRVDKEPLPQLSNCGIYVYGAPREHPPPHFHLLGPDTDCSVNIASRDVMKGHYSRKDLKEALDWIDDAINLAALVEVWRRLNERE